MTGTPRSVLVVGAGIVGLASACRLARQGHVVTVVDPAPGRGATWAAAGMIAASAEIVPGERDNYSLQRGALEGWRRLNGELENQTGRRVALHESGTLFVGWDAGDRAAVRQLAGVAAGFAAACTPVHRSDNPRIFGGLSERVSEGLLMADDAWLDPDEATEILSAALASLDVEVIADTVVEVSGDERSVVALTSTRRLCADVGLLTTGWSPLPPGAHASGAHHVRPVHGVTVRVNGADRGDVPMVRAFVRGRPFYLVSRPGGYCVLGASAEERADPGVQLGEVQRILRDGIDLVPDLETAPLLEIRSGLRPASDDGRPFLERLEPKGWGWLTGYYRHGVTLAPLAAQIALDFVEET